MDRQRERVEKEQDLKAQLSHTASLKAATAESERKLAALASAYRQNLQTERAEAWRELQRLEQEWAKQQHRASLLELRAPQAGVVKDLATHTPGTVVAPGTVMMTLVPGNEALQAEVWVSNQDVGFIRPGQAARVKVMSFPFQKYGLVEGKVTRVSADASEPNGQGKEGEAACDMRYKAIVALEAQRLEIDGEVLTLTPGMQVAGEVHLGERTVLEYLLSPVRKAFFEAGRER